MNIAATAHPAQQPAGISVATQPAALRAFLRPDCVGAIWQREIPPHIQRWLDALDPRHLPAGRAILRPQAVAGALGRLFDQAGLPVGAERDWLERDITALAGLFSDMLAAHFLRLRLDVVTNNACRRFHVDGIAARLICTYRGTGTQYGCAVDGGDPATIFTAPTGAPILLRGTLWPEQPPSGLLHRSPPIEGSGETRLLLVLDLVTDPEEGA